MRANVDPSELYWASFNSFEFRMPGEAVRDLSAQGDVMEAALYWSQPLRDQVVKDGFFRAPTPKKVRKELWECGAWEAKELKDDEANWRRIIWIGACNIAEEDEPDCSEPYTPRT